jgi:hypothetical protein
MSDAALPIERLIDINSDQHVLDVISLGLERAGLTERILVGLRTTAQAVVARLAQEQDLHLQESEQYLEHGQNVLEFDGETHVEEREHGDSGQNTNARDLTDRHSQPEFIIDVGGKR